jgi:hypothetical protein
LLPLSSQCFSVSGVVIPLLLLLASVRRCPGVVGLPLLLALESPLIFGSHDAPPNGYGAGIAPMSDFIVTVLDAISPRARVY